jgi:hypothetical protein
MEKKQKKAPSDINQLAKFIVDQTTTDVHSMNTPKEKNIAAKLLNKNTKHYK